MELEVRDLTVAYGETPAISGITFRVRGPALVAVLGPNGAGKTTLMRAILGLIRPVRGRVIYDGVDVTGRPWVIGRKASYVPQRPPTGRFVPFTPWELVCTSLLVRKSRWPRVRCPYRKRVEEALDSVGLPRDAWHRRLNELSGGMLMRSYIARSIALGSELVLMDEPFAPVDPAGRLSLARLIADMARERLVFVSLHDYMILRDKIDYILLVNRRLVAYGRPRDVLKPEILQKVYGGLIVEVERHVHIVDWHGEGAGSHG